MKYLSECNLCRNSDNFRMLATGNITSEDIKKDISKIFGKESVVLHTVMCANCGWIFQLEEFSKEELRMLYSDDDLKKIGPEEYKHIRREEIKKTILKYLKIRQQDDYLLLDIGGGTGEYSKQFLDCKISVHVVDL